VVSGGLEEIESKHRVLDVAALRGGLTALGFAAGPVLTHVDEYFDTADRQLEQADFVARLRSVERRVVAGFKGPRSHHPDGTYRRIEVEFPAATAEEVRRALAEQALRCVWRLEKRRREYTAAASEGLIVALDELPELGAYVEFEGPPAQISAVRARVAGYVGPAERRNYFELGRDWLRAQGRDPVELVF
jgi:predicted adenylyl cyclase CyaB